MSKYARHGKLSATPGNGDTLSDILIKASELVSQAEGCHLYLVSKAASDPDTIWVTEVWNSKEDHAKSLQLPGVGGLIAQAMPILAGMPSGAQELEVLGGL